jgi:hypothetical protein
MGACAGQDLGLHSEPAGAADRRPQDFLYHHLTQRGAPILCDIGVEVARTFETACEVYATETAGGEAVIAVHRGPYNRKNEAHNATEKWLAANGGSRQAVLEIYGDPTPDPADTETTIVHLLK